MEKTKSQQNLMWRLGVFNWQDFGARVWTEFWKDDLLGKSAQLAYYFLLALFPFFIFLISLFGLLLGANITWQKDLYAYLGMVLPGSAFVLIQTVLTEIAETGGTNLSFGLLLALFTASGGIEALMNSLNQIYNVEDKRSFWYKRILAIILTVILSVLILFSLILVLAGNEIVNLIAVNYGFGDFFVAVWTWANKLLILISVFLTFALVYYWSPDVNNREWHWITPGALVGVALWLLISLGFRLYLQYFDSYNKTYGSLGAVIILLLWLYFSSLAILLGGLINAEIKNVNIEKIIETVEEATENEISN